MTLDEFTAEVCERLRADMQSIRDPEGDIHPALFYSFDGKTIRRFKIPLNWFETGETKQVMARAIASATTLTRPRMIAFESTAWMVERRHTEAPITAPPSEHPDRREIVHVVVLDRTDFRYRSAPIERDGRNPPTYGDWNPLDDLTGMSGTIWDQLRRGMQG